ncbi:hypothetical protein ACJRO7_027751 [Eucalyptus globulus]|uniref:Squalene synthase n=1 Tax=Eucalyptus globulus TaxID=34317 RepID=A0ABD3JTG4_EUCGL
MVSLGEILKHPYELYPLLKLKMAARNAEKRIPRQPHWRFCYSTLRKFSKTFAFVIEQLPAELRHTIICVWYLSRSDTKDDKFLMDQFHHVSTAFLEWEKETIEDITKRMGEGMAQYICKEAETVYDYDEYCHYVSGLIGLGLSNLFHTSGAEDLAPDSLCNSMALILQDLKYEEKSVKAVQCLNEMVTNALTHVEDYLTYMSALRDPAIFRFWAIFQIITMGYLALCYNNVEVFRGVVKIRTGLAAKVRDRTRTMADVYGAFYDFSCMLKSKIDKNDPNPTKTLKITAGIQKACRDSGLLNKRFLSLSLSLSLSVLVSLIILAIILSQLSGRRSSNYCEFY